MNNTEDLGAQLLAMQEQHELDQVSIRYFKAVAEAEAMKLRIANKQIAKLKAN